MKKSKAFIILIIWALFSFALALKLYLENRFYAATGWAIITVIFTSFVMLYFLYFRKIPLKKSRSDKKRIDRPDAVQTKKAGNYVTLISTKDSLKAHAIKDALISQNVDCLVADQYSSEMMRFLQDVEMRIMVPAKDFERGLEIVKNIIREE